MTLQSFLVKPRSSLPGLSASHTPALLVVYKTMDRV